MFTGWILGAELGFECDKLEAVISTAKLDAVALDTRPLRLCSRRNRLQRWRLVDDDMAAFAVELVARGAIALGASRAR